jgi:hypothetical protein
VTGDRVKSFERGRALRLGPEHADENLGVTEVAGHFDRRDRDEAKNARILDVAREERCDLFSHRSGDAVGAMMIR